MVSNQVIDAPRFALRIGPLHVHLFAGGTIISDSVILNSPLLIRVAAAQFVPLVIGLAVFIDVLHNPNDTRFRRSVESVALNREVVFALCRRPFGDTMVEAYDDVAAESTKRHPYLLFQTPLGISYSCLLRRLRAVEPARLHLADELSRSRCIFPYLVPQRRTVSRGRTVAVLLRSIDAGNLYLGRERRFGTDNVAGKLFGLLLRFAYRNPDDMLSRFSRCVPEHARYGIGNRLAVHAPYKLRIVEVGELRFEEDRRADINIAVRRCPEDGLCVEENFVREFVHDFERNLFRRLAVDIRSVANNRIGAKLRLVERIGYAFGHDLALAQPFASKLLQIGVLNIGCKDVVRVLQYLQPF